MGPFRGSTPFSLRYGFRHERARAYKSLGSPAASSGRRRAGCAAPPLISAPTPTRCCASSAIPPKKSPVCARLGPSEVYPRQEQHPSSTGKVPAKKPHRGPCCTDQQPGRPIHFHIRRTWPPKLQHAVQTELNLAGDRGFESLLLQRDVWTECLHWDQRGF